MKFRLFAMLAAFSVVASAEEFNAGDSMAFNDRLQEMVDTTGWDFKNAINTKSVINDWQANQAYARLRYGSPNIYLGRVDKILVDNMATYFVVDYGTNYAATVVLDRLQPSWRKVDKRLEVAGMQSSLRFAASIKPGTLMYFQCRRVEFGLSVYLANCLAFPMAAALTSIAPIASKNIDAASHFDELIKRRAAEGWARPPTAHQGLNVKLRVSLLRDGTIQSVTVEKASGDRAYDQSAVNAVRNIGVLPETLEMSSSEYAKFAEFSIVLTPQDLML